MPQALPRFLALDLSALIFEIIIFFIKLFIQHLDDNHEIPTAIQGYPVKPIFSNRKTPYLNAC